MTGLLPSGRSATLHLLVFGSGFCALVYQVAWFRLFRSIFGVSTSASAAVLAIFMGGLGLGGLVLGRRVDRSRNPIVFYARLEIWISLLAASSPLLVWAADLAYRATGGSQGLGLPLATLARLVLAVLVLGLPTFLMGGTLPAVGRAITDTGDLTRRGVASLYGINAIGAVLGVGVTTFFWLELLGTRRTLWIAALLNLILALGALALGRAAGASSEAGPETERPLGARGRSRDGTPAPLPFLLVAAASVGFVFFVMELVWYRLLAPLLGGTTYTFGVILIAALGGIGVGGWAYSRQAPDRIPTLGAFGLTCALEALALGVPLALGDRLALFAQKLRLWSVFGFEGLVAGWLGFALLVIFPVAVAAGYQFPLLVALVGRGPDEVGRQVGLVYAFNTLGAIAGSLAGGFGLLPLLSATGAWRTMIVLLGVLSLATLLRVFADRRWSQAISVPMVATAAFACLLALGPTAYWRHSQIGAGRAEIPGDTHEFLAAWHEENRTLVWEEDGRESGIGLVAVDGYSFIVNGKSDGNCITDGATQVMGPLVGSMLHEAPRRGLVIGLGTGSSAGWLADVPEMERVDVVELEPAVLRVAETCAAVNRHVLSNPRVEVILGDGREVLLTTGERYDVIFSEPSNPYRAGIASLFTREFYRAVADRLGPRGLFVQWLQAYEIDDEVLETVYATLGDAFPYVETWASQRADLLLVASLEPVDHDPDRVESRAAGEPYREALATVWGVEGAAGFYSGYMAGPELSRELGSGREERNTDDRPVIEYGFARAVGQEAWVHSDRLFELDRERGRGYPPAVVERVGGEAAILEQVAARGLFGGLLVPVDLFEADAGVRLEARQAYERGDIGEAGRLWLRQESAPASPADRLLVADGLAELDHHQAEALRVPLLRDEPAAARVIAAERFEAKGRLDEARASLLAGFEALSRNPFVRSEIAMRAMTLALALGRLEPKWAEELSEILSDPLPAGMADERRKDTLFSLAALRGMEGCREALEQIEPHPFWNEMFLRQRLNCYQILHDPKAKVAARDLARFLAGANRPAAASQRGGEELEPSPEDRPME